MPIDMIRESSIHFGPNVQLLLRRDQTRQVIAFETIHNGSPSGYTMQFDQEVGILSIGNHTEVDQYLSDSSAKSKHEWIKEALDKAAFWAQSTAFSQIFEDLKLEKLDAVEMACQDIIEFVRSFPYDNVVRFLLHLLRFDSENTTTDTLNTPFIEAFEVLSTNSIPQDHLNILLTTTVQIISIKTTDGWIDQWVREHDRTTDLHKYLRRWHNQHSTITTTTSWTTHAPPPSFGDIAPSPNGDVGIISVNGFSIWDSVSDSWSTISEGLPALSTPKACGLWDGTWLIFESETVTKIEFSSPNHNDAIIKTIDPLLTIDDPLRIGIFHGRPFVLGRNKEHSLFLEIWDRRAQTWNAISIFPNPITAISRTVNTAKGCQTLVQSTDGRWMWLNINFFEGTVEQLSFPRDIEINSQMLSEEGLWFIQDNNVFKYSSEGISGCWSIKEMQLGTHTLSPYEAQQVVIISRDVSETRGQIKDQYTGENKGKPWISYTNEPFKSIILPDGRLWICTPKSTASIFI